MFSQTSKLKALARRLNDRRAARQSLFAFSRLDDRALKDIGVWRFELPNAAGRPMPWRWPR
jgi:uncharacterized protein YjiS (DUF1127 family)